MLYTVIFIGRSGCGKGTQAALLKDYINRRDNHGRQILYVETGDKFRTFIRGSSLSSKLSREIYEKDARQPDFLACMMWGNVLLEDLEENMHLVIDGAPRAYNEAVMLDNAFKFYHRENPIVVHIDVSRKWSEARLLARHRMDDSSLARIDKRLDWFDKEVAPALLYYKESPDYKYLEINGEQAIEKVHEDIIDAINDKAKN